MNLVPTAPESMLDLTVLPGVVRVEDASTDRSAMRVVFVDGVEVTITRALVKKSLFDMWLPPGNPILAATVAPNLDEATVMRELTSLAVKAASTN